MIADKEEAIRSYPAPNILEWRPFIRNRLANVWQVVPMKVLKLRFNYRAIKPVTVVFKRLARFYRCKDAPFFRPPLFNTVSSAMIAASFNGTCNGSSFFVRGM